MSLRKQRRLSGLKRTRFNSDVATRVLIQAALVFSVFLATACHPRPTEQMVLADVALKSAQKVKAESLAPDHFRKAENFYLRAKKDYAEGYYDSARKYADEARVMAEQAEFRSLKKQTELKGKTDDETQVPVQEGAK